MVLSFQAVAASSAAAGGSGSEQELEGRPSFSAAQLAATRVQMTGPAVEVCRGTLPALPGSVIAAADQR